MILHEIVTFIFLKERIKKLAFMNFIIETRARTGYKIHGMFTVPNLLSTEIELLILYKH
jgi:hypothetical protein